MHISPYNTAWLLLTNLSGLFKRKPDRSSHICFQPRFQVSRLYIEAVAAVSKPTPLPAFSFPSVVGKALLLTDHLTQSCCFSSGGSLLIGLFTSNNAATLEIRTHFFLVWLFFFFLILLDKARFSNTEMKEESISWQILGFISSLYCHHMECFAFPTRITYQIDCQIITSNVIGIMVYKAIGRLKGI